MATERKFEIKLLNQISDSQHHSEIVLYDRLISSADKRVTEGQTAKHSLGKPQFISN